ncbi:hypothetical protein OS493_033475 [Desmophyllum pertusum]|uniref:Protein kinase domain-containing protein n=1 Tax=Desmophyllum pertusum TaxID=174260 RepID=A0A9W9ZJ34_9CNID|nr:hypothetical protein OS493_033475 [Desmophyllum pertusum]
MTFYIPGVPLLISAYQQRVRGKAAKSSDGRTHEVQGAHSPSTGQQQQIRHQTSKDIKPDNLLLDAKGHVIFSNFGLSGVFFGQEKLNEVAEQSLTWHLRNSQLKIPLRLQMSFL